jgi:hypothetical protein
MPFASWPQLSVQVFRSTEAEQLLEEYDVAGEEDETIAVVREKGGQAPTARAPMNFCNRPAECAPPALVHRERYRLLVSRYQMGAEDRPDAHCSAGSLEFDRTIHPIGVGAGQRAVSLRGGDLRQHFGTGDASSKGKVRVDVEVGVHLLMKA